MEKLHEDRSFPSLEGLRLIASIMIVASHYFKYLSLPTRGLHLAVDLFFVISGIVIAMVYQGRVHDLTSYFGFMRKRIARLYPLHVATLLFYVIIGGIVAAGYIAPENPEKYNPSEIIPNLLMVHAWSPFGVISYNYVSWSISAEFFVYLCFPITLYILSVRGPIFGLAYCIAVLLIAIAISQIVLGSELPELNWTSGALRAMPSFTFGVWLWINRAELLKIETLRNHAGLAASLGMAALVGLYVLYPTDYPMLGCGYVIVVAAFVCDLTGQSTYASWGPVSRRGYLTYSIYMLHTVVATIVISFVFPRLFGKSQGSIIASVSCAAILTYVLAYFSYWYFETPLRSLIGGKRPATTTSTPATSGDARRVAS